MSAVQRGILERVGWRENLLTLQDLERLAARVTDRFPHEYRTKTLDLRCLAAVQASTKRSGLTPECVGDRVAPITAERAAGEFHPRRRLAAFVFR